MCRSRFSALIAICCFVLSGFIAKSALAEARLALLIGNQSYVDKVGPLKNPLNDIALVGKAFESLGDANLGVGIFVPDDSPIFF